VFPGITAVVALGGLVMDPAVLMAQSETLSQLLPDAGAEIVLGQLRGGSLRPRAAACR